jgi:Zn-dependent protease
LPVYRRGVPFAVRISRGLKVLAPVLLVAYGLGGGDGSWRNWLESASCVALLVGSVAVHEMGHVILARHLGLTVKQVTLTAFGGLTEYEGVTPSPLGDGLIAAAGPLASALLAATLLATRLAIGGSDVESVPSVLTFGVFTNVVITLVNLVPLPTLDGGMLTASLWKAMTHRRGQA